MAKTKQAFLRRIREIVERELEELPDVLAQMSPEKRAAAAIKLLSLTLDGKDLYSDDNAGGGDFWGKLPESGTDN